MKKITVKIFALIMAICLSMSLASCAFYSGKNPLNSAEPAERTLYQALFDNLLNQIFVNETEGSFLNVHYTLKNPAAYGVDKGEPELISDTQSTTTEKEYIEYLDYLIGVVNDFDSESLAKDQVIAKKMFISKLEDLKSSPKYEYYHSYISPDSATELNIAINLSEFKFYEKQDVEDYLLLLADVPNFIDFLIEYENERINRGMGLKDSALDISISQCNKMHNFEGEHFLVSTFNSRVDALKGLSEAEIAGFKAQNLSTVTNTVIPSYVKLEEAIKGFKGKGTEGIYSYQNGADYYAYLLRDEVGTDKSVEQVISMMDKHFKQLVQNYSMYYYFNGNKIAAYRSGFTPYTTDPVEILDLLKSKMTESFPEIGESSYTVNSVHESLEGMLASAFYIVPPIDDYKNNVIYINNSSTDNTELFSTLSHEGYPGHLYQNYYFSMVNQIPLRTTFNYKGYSEGWATYIENDYAYSWYPATDDAAEGYKVYEPYISLLNRYVVTRVDIGVNYQGWGVEDVANFLSENGLSGPTAEDIYNTAIFYPGAYLSYYVGYLEILELKDYAKNALGYKFNEKEFHKEFLEIGPAPFEIVEEYIKLYVEEKL